MLVRGVENQKNVAFCWNGSTHKLINKRIMKKYNPMLPEKMKFDWEIIEPHCVQPDYDRKTYTNHIHGHFADIDNLSKSPPDAYALTVKYTNKALHCQKDGNYAKRDIYLSYATHFLYDMLEPYHAVPFVPLSKTDPVRMAHKNFENVAEIIQEPVFKSTTINELTKPVSFFKEALPNAMRKAKDLHKRLAEQNESENNVVAIAASALDNTYKTADLYFKMLMENFSKIEPKTKT